MVDSIRNGIRLVTTRLIVTTHVSVAFLFLAHAMLLWKLDITCSPPESFLLPEVQSDH